MTSSRKTAVRLAGALLAAGLLTAACGSSNGKNTPGSGSGGGGANSGTHTTAPSKTGGGGWA